MRILTLILACLSFSAFSAEVIDASRRTPWIPGVTVGVKGGIPSWTNDITAQTGILQTNLTSATLASAIAAASNYSVINLPAITNTPTESWNITRNNVIVRGATNSLGWPTTVFNFESNGDQDGIIETDNGLNYPPNNWNTSIKVVSITGGTSNGSYQVFIAHSTNNLAVNNLLTIDQLDVLPYVTQGAQGHLYARPLRYFSQVVVVTNITGLVVSFDPPLIGKWWDQTKTPEAYTLNNEATYNIGFENLEVSRTDNGDATFGNFSLANGWNKWLKNVKSKQGRLSHAWLYYVVSSEVRDSYFTLYDLAQSSTYAIRPVQATGVLIENNIIVTNAAGISGDPSVGCVAAYNFAAFWPWNNVPDSMPETFFNHGGHSTCKLFEGNYCAGRFVADSYHGSCSFYTFNRNYFTGWDILAFEGQTTPFDYDPGATVGGSPITPTNLFAYPSVVGNIFGKSGYHTTTTNGGQFSIYDAEIFNPLVTTNALIQGNWNTVDAGIPTRESMGSATNAVSYYLTGKPAWMKRLRHPWLNVSDGVAIAANPHYYTNMAAGYRFHFGSNAPSGTVLNITTLNVENLNQRQ